MKILKYYSGVFHIYSYLLTKKTTKSLVNRNIDSVTRSNTNKLFKPRCNTNKFQHFFSNRIINIWNSLPREIVCAKSLNVFKNTLDKHWEDIKFSIDIV